MTEIVTDSNNDKMEAGRRCVATLSLILQLKEVTNQAMKIAIEQAENANYDAAAVEAQLTQIRGQLSAIDTRNCFVAVAHHALGPATQYEIENWLNKRQHDRIKARQLEVRKKYHTKG